MKEYTTEQQELLTLLNLQWQGKDMIDHCFKTSEYLNYNGKYIDIADKKPSITKTLWFDDERKIPDKNETIFIEDNMRLNAPKKMGLDSYHGDKLCITTQYCNDKTNGRLCGLTYAEPSDNNIEVTQELLDHINKVRSELAVKYKKRLVSYWKRYNKNVRFSGYWVNR